jgi:hypothetical protein
VGTIRTFSALAVHIVVSQLPTLFGTAKGGGNLLGQAAAVATHLLMLFDAPANDHAATI